jgi:hypothetical protein
VNIKRTNFIPHSKIVRPVDINGGDVGAAEALCAPSRSARQADGNDCQDGGDVDYTHFVMSDREAN